VCVCVCVCVCVQTWSHDLISLWLSRNFFATYASVLRSIVNMSKAMDLLSLELLVMVV
jgi:hypothetical protein